MSYIQTYTGKKFDFLNPTEDMIDIEDIAHSLSMQCRFNGHTTRFYSVAEHSVSVAHIAPDNVALEALLHDASEAYLCDIPSPLKPLITNYKELEYEIMSLVASKFKLKFPLPNTVKFADEVQLIREARDLMKVYPKWTDAHGMDSYLGMCRVTIGYPPEAAKGEFLDVFNNIKR